MGAVTGISKFREDWGIVRFIVVDEIGKGEERNSYNLSLYIAQDNMHGVFATKCKCKQ